LRTVNVGYFPEVEVKSFRETSVKPPDIPDILEEKMRIRPVLPGLLKKVSELSLTVFLRGE